MSTTNAGCFRLLFGALEKAGYEWQPQIPDRLISFRKNPVDFRPLAQWLGLGLPVPETELLRDGLPPGVLSHLRQRGLAFPWRTDAAETAGPLLRSTIAVSGATELFVVHDHWPPDPARPGGYVHCGAESFVLMRALNRDLEGFIGKRVLDLGCGSGALSLEVAGVADEVLGLDISSQAIEWAGDLSAAYGFKNTRFEVAAVGSPEAERLVGAAPWDVAVFNPPMVVPAKDAAYPHRDGGALGIETPFVFLDFAARHLAEKGEVHCLVTNPVVRGRDAFFDRFDEARWEVTEKQRLHSRFNQEVARKQGYAELGIEHIELWFLRLLRK